jgi:hypothetical protein
LVANAVLAGLMYQPENGQVVVDRLGGGAGVVFHMEGKRRLFGCCLRDQLSLIPDKDCMVVIT